jgi:hypothetical protein
MIYEGNKLLASYQAAQLHLRRLPLQRCGNRRTRSIIAGNTTLEEGMNYCENFNQRPVDRT